MYNDETSYLIATKAKQFSDEIHNYSCSAIIALPGADSNYINQKLTLEEVKILGNEITADFLWKPNAYSPERIITLSVEDKQIRDDILNVNLDDFQKMQEIISNIIDTFTPDIYNSVEDRLRDDKTIKQNLTLLNVCLETFEPKDNDYGIKLHSVEYEDGAYKVYYVDECNEPILYEDTLINSQLNNILSKSYNMETFIGKAEEVRDIINNTYDYEEIREVLENNNRYMTR